MLPWVCSAVDHGRRQTNCENISDITFNDHVVALDQLAREKSLSVEDPPDLSDSMRITQSSPPL